MEYDILIGAMIKLDVEKVKSSYDIHMKADYCRPWVEGNGGEPQMLKVIPKAWDWLIGEDMDAPSTPTVKEMSRRNQEIKDFLGPRLSIDYDSEEIEDYLCEVMKMLCYTKEGEEPSFNIDDELYLNSIYMFDIKECISLLNKGANPFIQPYIGVNEVSVETTFESVEARAEFGFEDMVKYVFDEPGLYWWTRSLDHCFFELLFSAFAYRLYCLFKKYENMSCDSEQM